MRFDCIHCRKATTKPQSVKGAFLRMLTDHKNLNDVLPCNPTAENIARWICEQVPHCVKVEVCESEGNRVIYEKD